MADTARTQPLPAAGTSATDDLRLEAQAYTGRTTAPGTAAPRTTAPGATTPGFGSPATGGDHRSSGLRDLPDPVEAAKNPDNRAKLLLATTAMTLLNLLLLLAVLANVVDDSRPEQVIVDGTPCIVSEQDGQNVLYCQR